MKNLARRKLRSWESLEVLSPRRSASSLGEYRRCTSYILDKLDVRKSKAIKCKCIKVIRVGDPDADPHLFGPPGSGSGFFPFLIKVLSRAQQF